MISKNYNDFLDFVILVGGLGTRLQSNKPKCLALINGVPFIDILINYYIKQGIKRFILSLGYLKEMIVEHLSRRDDCEIIFSIEEYP